MNISRRWFSCVSTLLLAIIYSLPSSGQVLKGSISGSVTDPTAAVVPGASVKATQIDTGAEYRTTTDNAGLFRLNLVPAGTYKVEITAPRFKTGVQSGISVTAGADTGIGPVKLEVGDNSEIIEVSATIPLIETSQAQVTNTFTGAILQNFAGIQENEGLDRLALFVPGVVNSRSDNFSNTNGVGFSSSGLRGRDNDQEIDGQNNNDNSVGGA